MARKISEIKNDIAKSFMADRGVAEKYGFAPGADFGEVFSRVSLESVIFYIVASAIYVLECLFDDLRGDVDDKLSTAVLATLPWYHQVCLEYQHGDELVFNDATKRFGYAAVDPDKRVIRYAACRDAGGGVEILVSSADAEGRPQAVADEVMEPFRHYLSRMKPAGIITAVNSFPPDYVEITVTVQYDPLLMNPDGTLIADQSRPVDEAVEHYVRNIVFGGTFNKTKLVDAVQEAAGVIDLSLDRVRKRTSDGEFTDLDSNNYTAKGGAFIPVLISRYEIQI